ncbi:restriction endonuclease subunit S [Shewanella gelidimarina]|uniref:restriction endonuclease subunit S n=1 Tax=Shewanella gelidimarina TaxID=56813 RepID=UPI00200DDB1C|nr:restriction endonuclease subunit S [Shewanella gelidimarina]MCL1056825.1 restriction endonuclease subunit S [Shewanella gelidimarina]
MANSNAVPTGWGISKINDTCEILDSKRIPLNSQERAKRVGIYPYYGANGVQGYIDDYIFEGEHVLLAEDGGNFDQWEHRPISYLVDGKFWVNNHAHILKAKYENITKFMHYSLVHKNILKHINGGTRAKLNQSDMRDIQFLRPPLPEQQKIAAILTSVDEVIEKTQAQIDKLKDLKTAMMQTLLTNGVGTKQGDATLNNSTASRERYIPHTEFKDSPVGRIPKSWEVVRLKQMMLQIRDGNYGADYPKASEMLDEGVPFLTSTVVGNDQKVNLSKLKFISKEKHFQLAKAHIKTNDVLFTNRGANVGNVALVPEVLEDANIGPQLTFLRVNEHKVTSLFLYIALQSDYFKKQLRQLDSGSAMNFFGIGTTEKFIFAVPPLIEQEEIAHSIYSSMIKVDKLNEKLKQIKALKKALMQDLLTGKVRVKVD